MKKVVFCIPPMTIGGVETIFGQTLQSLLKHPDIDITIFFHMPLSEPFWIDWFAKRPEIKQVVCFPLGEKFEKLKSKIPVIEHIRKFFFSIYKKYRITKIRKKIDNFDVVIDYVTSNSIKLLRYIKQPKITWIHSSYNYFMDNKLYDRVFLYDKIVCITDGCLNEITKNHPAQAKKLVRIYNPCDYKSIERKSKAGCNLPYKYFLCVSRLDVDKDIPTVINAFDKFWAQEKHPDCYLVIIGDGNKATDFKQLAKSKASHKNIVFLGKIPEPFGYMKNSIAHILSSYSEGLPTVMIEAAACGTLNIASDCPNGPHEIVLDGKAGILFKPGDSGQLAQIMSDVWNERINRQDLINKATESLSRFDADKITEQIIELLTKLN